MAISTLFHPLRRRRGAEGSRRHASAQYKLMTPQESQKSSFYDVRGLMAIVVLAVGYFATTHLGYGLEYPDAQRVALWPAVGFAVAGLVVFGRRAWPGIAIGGFIARLSAEPLAKDAAAMVEAGITWTGMTVAGVVVPVVAAWLFERYRLNTALNRLRDVLIVVLFGAVSSVLGAMISTAVLIITDVLHGHAALVFFGWWWVTDTMGIILVSPPLLVLATAVRLRTNPFQGRGVEIAVLILLTVIATRLLFYTGLPVSFLVFPFVLWAALRLGVPGAAVVNIFLAGIAIWVSIKGQGPFAQLPPMQSLLVLQSFSASVAITSLVLAAVTAERQQATDEVRASRIRIVETADAERRRVERNLHDGAQQRLVSLSLLLRLAQMRLGAQPNPELKATLGQASDELQGALTELRELARGLHPAILTQEGLGAAVQSLAEQAPLPVAVTVSPRRFSAAVEVTAYFIVCEALVNIAKYAQASAATVSIEYTDRRLSIEVADDGIGGADPDSGSGLGGLADRVAALGGELYVNSPTGGGTRVRAELPCD